MKTIIQFSSMWIVLLSIVLFTQCQKSDELSPMNLNPDRNELSQSLSARGMNHDEGVFNFKVDNCIETIFLTGEYKFIFSDFKITNGGRFSIHSKYEIKGRGIGAKSGNVYEWLASLGKSTSGNFINGQYSQTYFSRTKIIGHGDLPDTFIDFSYSFRINANGEIVVDDVKATSTCD
jgi:hypothetical protein